MLKSVVLKADLRLPLRHEKNYRDHLNPKEVGIAVAFAPKLRWARSRTLSRGLLDQPANRPLVESESR